MPSGTFGLKPTHKAVKQYYSSLEESAQLQIDHGLGPKHGFEGLLEQCARKLYKWSYVREPSGRLRAKTLRPDGWILDGFVSEATA